jgi:hypothetical protein
MSDDYVPWWTRPESGHPQAVTLPVVPPAVVVPEPVPEIVAEDVPAAPVESTPEAAPEETPHEGT